MRILGVTASSILKVTSSYESIASATGTGTSATITLSSIPATYKHLQIRTNIRNLTTGTSFRTVLGILNGDTGTNYTRHGLVGDGSAVSNAGNASGSNTAFQILNAAADGSSTANVMGVAIIDILDYASTSKYKTIRMFTGVDFNGSGRTALVSSLWLSTSAINSITFEDPVGNGFTTSSTFALYGIKG